MRTFPDLYRLRIRQRTFVALLFLLSISSCISIVKAPSTKNNYSEMSRSEKEGMRYPPDSSFRFAQKEVDGPGEMELYEIDKERLEGLMDPNGNAWVAFWATWCVHCINDLPDYCEKDSLREDMQLFLVSSNYDPENLKKFAYNAGYRKPLFVIDAKRYGEEEILRLNAFVDAIAGKDLDTIKGLPRHLFFKEKEWVGQLGKGVSQDTLDHFFK